jgi:hypothetical protein
LWYCSNPPFLIHLRMNMILSLFVGMTSFFSLSIHVIAC